MRLNELDRQIHQELEKLQDTKNLELFMTV